MWRLLEHRDFGKTDIFIAFLQNSVINLALIIFMNRKSWQKSGHNPFNDVLHFDACQARSLAGTAGSKGKYYSSSCIPRCAPAHITPILEN